MIDPLVLGGFVEGRIVGTTTLREAIAEDPEVPRSWEVGKSVVDRQRAANCKEREVEVEVAAGVNEMVPTDCG